MRIQIVTLFPDIFKGVFSSSMLWKAQDKNLVTIDTVNLRDFGLGNRKTVDDTPYGGGDGMLLKPEPLFDAVEYCKKVSPDSRVLLMTPRGFNYNQQNAEEYASKNQDIIIICGRYEGYDERITSIVDDEICIGPFVLTGGEIPSMIITDSIVRLIPGVLGGENSAIDESFVSGSNIREFPQYTRPESFRGLKVPDVLLSGNHQQILEWRNAQSIKATKKYNK